VALPQAHWLIIYRTGTVPVRYKKPFHGQRSSKIRQHRSTNFFYSVTGMISVNKLGTYMIPKAKKQWRQKPIIKETAIKPEQLVKMT
jgi:hypothetical protein